VTAFPLKARVAARLANQISLRQNTS
jgi:hypothetical protein